MGCETTSYCKDIRGLGRVLPKVEKVIVGLLGSRNWHPVQVAHHTQGWVQWYLGMCLGRGTE